MNNARCLLSLMALLVPSRQTAACDDTCEVGDVRLVAFDAAAEIAVFGQASAGGEEPWRYLVYSTTEGRPRFLHDMECPDEGETCSWASLVGGTRWKRLRWDPGEELPGDGFRWTREDEGTWSFEARTAHGWERVLRAAEPEHILSVLRSPRATYVVLGRDDLACRRESQRILRLARSP